MSRTRRYRQKLQWAFGQDSSRTLRTPKIYNLRSDPFECAPESINYADWFVHRSFILVPAQALVASRLESFREYPPRAKAASFTVNDAMEKIISAANPNK